MEDSKKNALAIRDEIPFLGTRQKSNLGSAQEAHLLVRDLREAVRKDAVRSGEDAHLNGTKFAILYKGLAERHYDRKSFLEFVRLDVGLARTTFYDWIRVARYATATQARWGIATCLAAGRLVEYLQKHPAKAEALGLSRKPQTISDLRKVTFPLDGGRTLKFEGDTIIADDVELALQLLDGSVRDRPGISNAQRRGNERLREAIKTKAALKGVEGQLVRRKGKNGLKLFIPSGSNLLEIARAIERALEET